MEIEQEALVLQVFKVIDPPEGWKYGFPKAIPEDVENVKEWLVQNGYPESVMKQYGDYFSCRYWYAELID